MDFRSALIAFEKEASSRYGCQPEEVHQMVWNEVDRHSAHFVGRKTAKQLNAMQWEALAHCRGWLDEERVTLTADDVRRYAPAKCYFTALVPIGGLSARQALDLIADELSSQVRTQDTLDRIAELIQRTGRTIEEPKDDAE